MYASRWGERTGEERGVGRYDGALREEVERLSN
jgi:hypothetical protein